MCTTEKSWNLRPVQWQMKLWLVHLGEVVSMFFVWEEEGYLTIRRAKYSRDYYVCSANPFPLSPESITIHFQPLLLFDVAKWLSCSQWNLQCMIQHSLFLSTGLNQRILKPSGMMEAWGRNKLCLKCLPIDFIWKRNKLYYS